MGTMLKGLLEIMMDPLISMIAPSGPNNCQPKEVPTIQTKHPSVTSFMSTIQEM
jgi:hypothetical protein